MSDEREYEQACLEAVRQTALGDESLENLGIEIHDVRLEGSYPDTRLVVDIEFREDRDQLDWRLWADDFGERTPGDPPYAPEGVAQDIYVQLIEFQ